MTWNWDKFRKVEYVKICRKTFKGFYKLLSRNVYREVKENCDKPRRSYSITRPNKKPSTSKIQIYDITAELGRQVDKIPQYRTNIQLGKDCFPFDPSQLYPENLFSAN